MKMMWAQSDFFHSNIYNLVFSEKKFKLEKFCPCGFLWLKSVNKVLRICSWYVPWQLGNFQKNVSDA